MDSLYIKIGDVKMQVKFTPTFAAFKQEVAQITGTANFTVLYCQEEDFEKLVYTQVNSQEEFKQALKIIQKLNRFFKIDLTKSGTSSEVVSSVGTSSFIDESSFQNLYSNEGEIRSLINSAVPKKVKSPESSETSKISSEKTDRFENLADNYKYENVTFNVAEIRNREKMLMKKLKKFSIELQSGVGVKSVGIGRRESFKVGKCSNCKQLLKTEFYKCTHCALYSLCPSCPRVFPHQFERIGVPKEVLISDLAKKFVKMGFTDENKIQELIISTNFSYTRTLSGLLGY